MDIIKNKNIKFKKISKKSIALVLLLIVSILICLYNFGKHIDPPLSTRAEINNSSVNAEEKFFEEGNGGVVIDTGLTRLQFLNADNKVVGIENPNIMNQSVCYFQDCVIENTDRYVLEYTTYANSKNIKTEQVIKYNNLGFVIKTVLQNTYANEDNIKTPRLISLSKNIENKILAVQISNNNETAIVIDVNSGNLIKEIPIYLSNEKIIDARYNSKTTTLGILTNNGQIILYDNNNKNIIDNDPSAKKITFDDENKIKQIKANADSINYKYDFSFFYIIKNLLFWMALCYLIIFILCFIIKMLKKKTAKKVLMYCGIALGIIILLVTVVFYSYQYFNLEIEQQIQIIKTSSRNTSLNSKNFIKNEIKNSNSLIATQSLQEYLETIKSNATDNNINIEYGIAIEDITNDTINLLYSTNYKIRPAIYKTNQLIGKNISQATNLNNEYVFNDYSGLRIGVSEQLFDLQNNQAAYLYVSSDLLSLNSDFLYNIINAFILLLSIIITISLLLFEIYGFLITKKTYKKYKLAKFKHPEIGFTRTFVFLQQFLISFDSALMVLIAIDLLNASNMTGNPALISIPTVCCSIGMTISTPLFNIVSKKINIRPIIIVCSILLIVFYILDFVAIIHINFFLYCTFISFGGIFCGMLNSIQWYLPLLSPNDDIRFDINKTTVQASVASSIIAVAVCGIIADYFGSQWVYIFAILSIIGIIAMGVLVFPKKQKYYKPQEKNKLSHVKKSFRFFLSPIFICYVLFLYITVNISGSYKGLLFPIFSSSAGFSKSMISNFIVITNFVAMFLSSTSKNITKNNNYFSLSIISVFMIGLTFLSFNINDSVIWSVAVIAVIAIFSKIASLNNAMIWPILCKDKNFSEQTCNKFLKYTNDIIFTAKNLILSSLLVFGSSAVCNILGVYTCIGVLIFTLICFVKKKFKI